MPLPTFFSKLWCCCQKTIQDCAQVAQKQLAALTRLECLWVNGVVGASNSRTFSRKNIKSSAYGTASELQKFTSRTACDIISQQVTEQAQLEGMMLSLQNGYTSTHLCDQIHQLQRSLCSLSTQEQTSTEEDTRDVFSPLKEDFCSRIHPRFLPGMFWSLFTSALGRPNPGQQNPDSSKEDTQEGFLPDRTIYSLGSAQDSSQTCPTLS